MLLCAVLLSPFFASAAQTALQISPFYAVGDSIANQLKGVNIPTTARDGANPNAILGMIQSIPAGSYKDKVVILSSGASNLSDERVLRQVVPAQIQALRAGGAKNIILLGVGPGVKSGINAVLQQIAAEQGVRFSNLARTYDNIHPVSAKESLAQITSIGDLDVPASGVPTPVIAQTPFSLTNTVPPATAQGQPLSGFQHFLQAFNPAQSSAQPMPTQTSYSPLAQLGDLAGYQPTQDIPVSSAPLTLSPNTYRPAVLNPVVPQNTSQPNLAPSQSVSMTDTFSSGAAGSGAQQSATQTNDASVFARLWGVLDGARGVVSNMLQYLR